MNMNKVYELTEYMLINFTFDEISRAYREVLYNKYVKLTEYQPIHCYQLLRGNIDIFTQMINGREFDEEYLKQAIKW